MITWWPEGYGGGDWIYMVAAGGGAGVVYLFSREGCPYLALYMQPGRVYMRVVLHLKLWLLGLHLGLQVGLRLGRIGYANGGVPGGYAHVSSPRVFGRFEESGRDSEQHVE